MGIREVGEARVVEACQRRDSQGAEIPGFRLSQGTVYPRADAMSEWPYMPARFYPAE